MKNLARAVLVSAGLCLSAAHAAGGDLVVDGGDLNADGWPEAIEFKPYAPYAAKIQAIDTQTGKPVWASQITAVAKPGSQYRFDLARLSDLTGDKKAEFAFVWLRGLYIRSGSDGAGLRSTNRDDFDPSGPPDRTLSSVDELRNSIDRDQVRDLVVGSHVSVAFAYDNGCPTLNQPGAVFAISSATGKLIWKREAPGPAPRFGETVAALSRDYDGDGLADIAAADPCAKTGSGALARQGKIYILSAKTGATIKEFANPVVAGAYAPGNWFGWDVIEIADADMDGVPDLAVGTPSTEKLLTLGRVILLSGADGKLLCDYLGFSSRFGWDLAGGRFAFGDPMNTVYAFGSPKPHDIVVAAPGDRTYVLRLDPKACRQLPPLATFYVGLKFDDSRSVGILSPKVAPVGQASYSMGVMVSYEQPVFPTHRLFLGTKNAPVTSSK